MTAKDLLDGLANPSRWLTQSGEYAGHRFSPLTQIMPANVGNAGVRCRSAVPESAVPECGAGV